ncbi:(Fe-S)-binding protein [Salinadaptatus halalkaliphilus]|uniref:(Fe-S)-binding protein n=1 Tax=Salinadaptatus halalkaliphilus TaxID=2419781 RepID=A0A4S3TQ60_9EURY|nr:(Fe-S)-binding protein [Salinadaptatus halalkaliphilus]THE64698.1 (Fe-S)-binding protein [Salinadaptatus halalkaliphilus]
MDILEKLEFEAVALGGYNNCCGIEDMKRGNIETAETLDDNRFENISALDPDYAVAECSSCHSITETASLGYRSPDFEFPFMPEFLLAHRERFRDAIEVTNPVTVTFHDHFDYRGWMSDEQMDIIRDLFATLPGVEIVEMEHTKSDRLPCALSASPDEHPYDDINRQIYREAEAAGADVLVNIWHGCHRCLLPQEHEFPVTTKNYSTFLAERLGFEYSDTNCEYLRLAREEDLDAVVEAARSIFEANNLSEERAHQVVEAHYWSSA